MDSTQHAARQGGPVLIAWLVLTACADQGSRVTGGGDATLDDPQSETAIALRSLPTSRPLSW